MPSTWSGRLRDVQAKSIYYSSFHFLFHYPQYSPIYCYILWSEVLDIQVLGMRAEGFHGSGASDFVLEVWLGPNGWVEGPLAMSR